MANSGNEHAIGMDEISAAPALERQTGMSGKAPERIDPTDTTATARVPEGEENDEKRGWEMPDADLQRGVQEVEAITLSWSKWRLAAVLFK